MFLKKIMKNVSPLNVALLALVTIFASYGLSPLLNMKVKYALPTAKKTTEIAESKASQPQVPSIAEYTIVSEENLFHPERRIPPEKKEEEALPKPDFVLFGTVLSDDVKLAYMEDLKSPRTTAGRGKRLTALKEGDSMSGFTLKDIETDKVVMVRGTESLTVPISDPSHPKTRVPQGPASQPAQHQPAPAIAPVRPPATPQQKTPAGSKAPAPVQAPSGSAPPAAQTPPAPAPTITGSPQQTLIDLFRRGARGR